MEKRNRIPKEVFFHMLAWAGLFDSVQFITTPVFVGLVLSPIISVFAWLTFFFWFKKRKVGFMDFSLNKYALRRGLAQFMVFLELVPALDALPFWIVHVILMVSAVKAEDIIYNEKGVDIKIGLESLMEAGEITKTGLVFTRVARELFKERARQEREDYSLARRGPSPTYPRSYAEAPRT